MARHCLRVALQVLALLRERHEEYLCRLLERLDLAGDLQQLQEMADLLYVPEPDKATLVVEQFDGYHKLEDVSVDELKSRVQVPTEYLGGGNGLATTTTVLKQADVVALLTLFRADYPAEVKRANWDYYDQRTEQGSTLSASLYATLAADVGLSGRAYDYFMTTATVDLTGNYKRYVGNLYIGGTHPGANGGAWMTVVHGFAGLHFDGSTMFIIPALPSHWERVSFNVVVRQQSFRVEVGRYEVRVTAGAGNTQAVDFAVGGRSCVAPRVRRSSWPSTVRLRSRPPWGSGDGRPPSCTSSTMPAAIDSTSVTRRLTEVAAKVGVSEATVSRVLNGRPGVSAATRTAVLTALDVLGYERPTELRGKRARLVGLVLPELQNPIFPALAEVVGGALAQLHFTPVLCASGPNGIVRGRLREHAARPARLRSDLRGRQLRRSRIGARPLPATA